MHHKIILVSNTSWSFYKFRKGLISWFVEQGHEVYLLSPADEHIEDLQALGAVHIALQAMSAKGINPQSDIKCYYELKRLYKLLAPDIIFHYTIKPNIYGTLAANKVSIPSVAVVTGLGFTFINKGIVPTIAKQLYKRVLRKANRVWFLNQDDLSLFHKLSILPPHLGEILHGEGIDCTHFAPITDKSIGSATEFVFIGRLLYDKGIQEYYEAARKVRALHPEVKCSVMGYLGVNNPKAVDESKFRQWVDEGTIHYYGSSQDVRPIMQQASCIVLPSYREGLSMVLLEAAAMATPIIATNIPGCKEVVEDGRTGYLVAPMQSEELAEAMIRFHRLPTPEKESMGSTARQKIINEFSLDKVCAQYQKVLTELFLTEAQ